MSFFDSKKKKNKKEDIWYACETGNEELLEQILKKKKNCLNMPNSKGRYPIHISASKGFVNICEMLLKAGADCNVIEENEPRWNVLHFAIQSKDPETVYLFANLPQLKVAGLKNKDRNTPLHHFCRHFTENYKNIVSLLIEKGDVNAINRNGETPLHNACWTGKIEIVQVLIDYGANTNMQNDHGETPLHWAARMGYANIVKLLLEVGADPTVQGTCGLPIDVASTQEIKDLLSPKLKSPIVNNEKPKYHWEIDYNELIIGQKIGSGGFGVVYKGMWRGIDVAIKMINLEKMSADVENNFLREINVMSKLRHQNVLLFLGACIQKPNFCLVTEFIQNGSLNNVLKNEKLSLIKKLTIAIETTKALMYLHSQDPPILHRDLKTGNLLVDENYHIKVADFGLSKPEEPIAEETEEGSDSSSQTILDGSLKTSNEKREGDGGTLYCMAPEVLHRTYTKESDIYSLGIILYEIITETVPYDGLTQLQMLRSIEEGDSLNFPPDIDPEIQELIKSATRYNPSERLPLDKILEKLWAIKTKYSKLSDGVDNS